MLPAGESDENGVKEQERMPSESSGAGPAVIPLKETLARRLSASMDCIEAVGDNEKLSAAAAADATATTDAPRSERQSDVDEPAGTEVP